MDYQFWLTVLLVGAIMVATMLLTVGAFNWIARKLREVEQPLFDEDGNIWKYNFETGVSIVCDPNADVVIEVHEWPSIRAAAKSIGVSDRTLRRWRDEKGCDAFSKNNRVALDPLIDWMIANDKFSPVMSPTDMMLEENELACEALHARAT